ncbi:MAG: hypothetical protein IJ643_07970 [Eubacterium sp.]|nr:hypothetical protein [Eubacterium sp.]
MKKDSSEIKRIANQISSQEGKYFFSMTEICTLFGICKDTARDVCKHLTPVVHGGIRKYYIVDILEYFYSQKD